MKGSSYGERDYAFGQRILTLRTQIGLTQAGLADLLGLSRRAVAQWEAGTPSRVQHAALSWLRLVGVLPGLGAFLFLSGSRFGATPHDDAHDAFMALPPYTRSREHDGQPVVSAAMRQPTQQMLTRRII